MFVQEPCPLNTERQSSELLLAQPPTLHDALLEARIEDPSPFVECSLENVKTAKEFMGPNYPNLTEEEAGAIASYCLRRCSGPGSPRGIIDTALAGAIGNAGAALSSRKLVCLFLSGLRKLPYVTPQPGQPLYTVYTSSVPLNPKEANGTQKQVYELGRKVTWGGITVATTDFEAACSAASKLPKATIFKISGEQMWCYDIQPFSPSDKVLFAFEPGLRLVVGKSDRTGTVPVVDMTFHPYEGFVMQDICPMQMPVMHASNTDDGFASDYVKGLGSFVSNTLSWDCRWDEPSDKLGPSNRYTLDEENPTIATFTRKRAILGYGVVTGFAPLP